MRSHTVTPLCSCHVSHDFPNAGFDPLAAPLREGEGVVKWPILAQLPWVGEPQLEDERATPPVDVLPFADSMPEPYVPPTFQESEALAPQLRIVDPALPRGEEFAALETVDRRLHRATPAGRTVAESSHLNLHRFPATATIAEPVIEPQRSPVGASPSSRQHRRFDPPQPRYGEGLALHHPNESLAAQLYQWQAVRKPQTALIAMGLLLLTAGGLYFFTVGRPAAEPKEVAAPPVWEIQPLEPVSGGVNEALAAPLPASPALDLSTRAPADATVEPAASDPQQPMTDKSAVDAEDPIAAWLNKQPQLPQLTASKDALELPTPAGKPVETQVEKPVMPAAEPVSAPQPTTAPTTDQSITPTPAILSPTLTSPYPTTQYPPFPATLALPSSNSWPPAVADTLGPAFDPPQPPR